MARLSRLVCLASLTLLSAARADDASDAFFELKIRPVLVTKCLPCHGGKKTESKLRVDSRAACLRGDDRGPAIISGDPDSSLLVQAIRQSDEDLKMPPVGRLPDEVIADFANWIASGAVWPAGKEQPVATQAARAARHWALRGSRLSSRPQIRRVGRCGRSIVSWRLAVGRPGLHRAIRLTSGP